MNCWLFCTCTVQWGPGQVASALHGGKIFTTVSVLGCLSTLCYQMLSVWCIRQLWLILILGKNNTASVLWLRVPTHLKTSYIPVALGTFPNVKYIQQEWLKSWFPVSPGSNCRKMQMADTPLAVSRRRTIFAYLSIKKHKLWVKLHWHRGTNSS